MTITEHPQFTVTTLDTTEIRDEIAHLEAQHGSYQQLRENADRGALTPDGRRVMRRLKALYFLAQRDR